MSKSESREITKKGSKLRAIGLGTSLMIAAAVGAGAEHVTADNGPTKDEVATQEATEHVALEHSLNVLLDGTASIRFENGTLVNIDNPVLQATYAEDGTPSDVVVLARTMGSDSGESSLFTPYTVGSDVPNLGKVKNVVLFHESLVSDGDPDLLKGLGYTNTVQLERHDGLSGHGDPRDTTDSTYLTPSSEQSRFSSDIRVAEPKIYDRN